MHSGWVRPDQAQAQAAGGADGEALMPSTSEKQRRFMGAEYARAKAGKKTQTGMSKQQLRDFARKVKR